MCRAELVVLLDTVYCGNDLCTRIERFLDFFKAHSTGPFTSQPGTPVVNSLALAFMWVQRLLGNKGKLVS